MIHHTVRGLNRRRSLLTLAGLLAAGSLASLILMAAFGAANAGACGQPGDAGQPIQPTIIDNGDGTETHTYYCGPITVTGGANKIRYPVMRSNEKPSENGWITSIEPDLVAVDEETGQLYVPTSDKVMFHHGVWINFNRDDATAGRQRFYATGEEKTALRLPEGYGYRYLASDNWVLNHMIHNLVPEQFTMYIKWKITFIPDDSPLAEDMTPVRPIWMDVENGSFYPVFDVHRGDGGKDGKFTFPDDTYGRESWPYGAGTMPKNRWRVDRDGYIVASVGHVHSGGLWTDLNLIREGATNEGPSCASERGALNRVNARLKAVERQLKALKKKAARIPASQKARKAAARRAIEAAAARRTDLLVEKSAAEVDFDGCRVTQPQVTDDYLTDEKKVLLFRSNANYFDRNERKSRPVSWDMGMYNTPSAFRVQLKAGDILETNTTYETKIGSWYESMGIHISYMADGQGGDDPFAKRVDIPKELNHGPKAENAIHGGDPVPGAADPVQLPDGLSPTGDLLISGFTFGGGAFFQVPGAAGRPLVVEQGKSLRFRMSAEDWGREVWHSLTACKSPCNRSTGIAYPLPNGEPMFDSGQMGRRYNGSGANGREYWDTPRDLPVGTHTFFCRIHPLMRGAVRVVPKN